MRTGYPQRPDGVSAPLLRLLSYPTGPAHVYVDTLVLSMNTKLDRNDRRRLRAHCLRCGVNPVPRPRRTENPRLPWLQYVHRPSRAAIAVLMDVADEYRISGIDVAADWPTNCQEDADAMKHLLFGHLDQPWRRGDLGGINGTLYTGRRAPGQRKPPKEFCLYSGRPKILPGPCCHVELRIWRAGSVRKFARVETLDDLLTLDLRQLVTEHLRLRAVDVRRLGGQLLGTGNAKKAAAVNGFVYPREARTGWLAAMHASRRLGYEAFDATAFGVRALPKLPGNRRVKPDRVLREMDPTPLLPAGPVYLPDTWSNHLSQMDNSSPHAPSHRPVTGRRNRPAVRSRPGSRSSSGKAKASAPGQADAEDGSSTPLVAASTSLAVLASSKAPASIPGFTPAGRAAALGPRSASLSAERTHAV